MPSFNHDGVEIAFLDEGEGEPIVLVHGFASNKEVNWVFPGWVSTLRKAGRRVIALDNRGHGASTKLYDPAAYHSALMADDVRYSMGARNTTFLAMANPERLRSGILGGVGSRLVGGVGLSPDTIAQGLEAPSLADISDPTAHQFRSFAEQTRSDLRALAACIRGSRQPLERDQLAHIAVPILVATGTKDTVAGSGEQLAALIPGAQSLPIPDREHMLAVGDKVFKAGVLEFLAARP
jgi:pimeloyl-ACP methyl ester carboxylesterase